MAIHQDFKDMFRCLNDAEVRYLVVGAYAVSFYTEPRYTKDIDILVEPTPENAIKVYDALLKFGSPLKGVGIDDLMKPDFVYQIGVAPVRIDILTGISDVDFKKAWSKKKTTCFDEEKVFIVGFDDLVKTKKAASRPQDKLDLEKLAKAKRKKKR